MKKHILYCTVFLTVAFIAGCGGPDGDDAQASEAASASEGGTVLTTEFPAELIEGTPAPIKAPNLVQAPAAPPSMVVPEGTVLLSLDKEVTSSDTFPIVGDVSYITDGDKQAGEGYFVELIDGLQWVQIDLGQSAEVSALWVWHYHSQKRAYHDVIVQVSEDPEFGSGVITLFNNDYDDSAGLGRGSDRPYVESRWGKLIDGKSTTARYVRLYTDGNTTNSMNHYIEVEVYGVPKE